MNAMLTPLTLLIIAGMAGMTMHSIAAPNDANSAMTSAAVPVPKLQKTIELGDVGSVVAVRQLTFSPDSRYLAIVVDPELGKTDIVVWDMQMGKRQSHIHCSFNYGVLPGYGLLWSSDGRVISFGAKKQWNPLTGEALPDNPAVGHGARLNKDGSKMLTIVGAIGEPSYIHIYDTQTWASQIIYVDGLAVETAAWTAEDKIMVGVHLTKEAFGKTIDGHPIPQIPNVRPDVALRLLDPTGKESTKAIWFPAAPDNRPHYAPWMQAIDVELSVANFPLNQIALGAGRIINGKTMDILTYYPIEDVVSNKVSTGTGGMVFSPNGKYLFIKSSVWFDGRKPVTNAIIDTATGKQVGVFGGGDKGIAISPDGGNLAIGNRDAVQILSLH